MIKKVVLLPDVHLDTRVSKEYQVVKKFIKRFKPDEIVIMGDYMDISALSAWDMDKKRLMEGRRLQKEYDVANRELDYLQKYTKKITYLEGNHPYHKDTEVLTEDGWCKIKDLVMLNKKVAQFKKVDDQYVITYDYPLGWQKVYTEKTITFENNYTKQVVNPEHKVYYNDEKICAGLLVGKKLDKYKFVYGGNIKYVDAEYNSEDIKVITWIVMDGTLVFRNKKPHHIQFKLSKDRKIKELTKLLVNNGVKYTIQKATKSGVNKLQPYIIRIYGDDARKYFKLLNNKKEFPDYFSELEPYDFNNLLNTIEITDGHKSYNHINWITINKHNLDVIMKGCVQHNLLFKYTINKNKSGFKSNKTQYNASFYNSHNINNNVLQNIKVSVNDYNDYCYCLTMPEGTLITRIDGKVAFSGNCDRVRRYLDKHPEMEGMIEVPTNLRLKERGIEYLKYNELYKLGHLRITHGMYTNEYHTKKTLQTFGDNIVYGHIHRPQSYMINMALQKPIMAWSLGALCDKAPDYLQGKPANWMSGFGIVYYDDKTGNFNLYSVNIIHKKFIWDGVMYE